MDRKIVTVKSYANIAIIKYWGKADAVKMIPATSSISLTLESMFTTTTVSFFPQSVGHDEFYINGVLQDEKEHAKKFLPLSTNTVVDVPNLSKLKLVITCQPLQVYHQVQVDFQRS